MQEKTVQSLAGPLWLSFVLRHNVLTFSIVTVALTFGIALLPLPTLVTPMLMILVPTFVAIVLISLTDGFRQVRNELFRANHWRLSLRWLLIPFGFYVVHWFLSLGLASLFGIPPQVSLPPLSPVHLFIFFFAAGEEIGWRGYALPRLLKTYSPLAASLLLGIPWAALHYALMLPGELLVGKPLLGHSLLIFSVSVILTWTYLRSKRNLSAVTILHGWINTPGFLMVGDENALFWLAAVAWAGLALSILFVTKGKLAHTLKEGEIQ